MRYNVEYDKNRRNTDPIYRLINNNRCRIRAALHSNNKATSTINLLGCTKEFYYNWIIFQLPYNMSDSEFKELYEIDHVRPISSFDLSIKENQFEAIGWPNCSPLLKQQS